MIFFNLKNSIPKRTIMIRTKLINTFLFLCMTGYVFAQQSQTLERADRLYRNGEYSKAIEGYLDYLVQHTDDKSATIRLARCYENTGDYLAALAYYNDLIEQDSKPSALYLLKGNLLKKMMRFDEAVAAYARYKTVNKERAIARIKSCRFAKELAKESEGCNIENLSFNSKQSDYNPVLIKGQLVYTSKRALLEESWVAKGDKTPVLTTPLLYKVGEDESPEPYVLDRNTTGVNVTPSFTPDGRNIAYAIGEDSGVWKATVKSTKDKNMHIVLSSYDDVHNTWVKRDFPYNSNEYSNGFPHLADDGKTMFFASNMPGGYGKFDIYVSYWQGGGWSKPSNLGPEVNTQGNEISPFLDDDKLYFASDYQYGLGGYDVFRIHHQDNAWTGLENLGACVNSPNDDYGMVIDPSKDKAYFTSNRLGGKGHEDIYAVQDIDQVQTKKVFTPKSVDALPERVLPLEWNTETPSEDISKIEVQLDLLPDVDLSLSLSPALSGNQPAKIPLELPTLELPAQEDRMEMDNQDVQLVDDYTLSDLVRDQQEGQKVYFVQIAALSHKKNLDRFKHFQRYGNVYQVRSGGLVKIRIGFFSTVEEAKQIASQLKARGIREAFIVGDDLQTAQLEIIATAKDRSIAKGASYEETRHKKHVSPYKIRVVSYHFPNRINTAEVADLGKIEHWTKEDWKIIILSGYENLSEAKRMLQKVHQRGFKDAYIVKESFGKLQRVRFLNK